MQIVTDSGTDVSLSVEERAALGVHIVPLVVTLDGQTYQEGVDINADSFYPLLAASDGLPITSQPSAGVLAEVYRKLAIGGYLLLGHSENLLGLETPFESCRLTDSLVYRKPARRGRRLDDGWGY